MTRMLTLPVALIALLLLAGVGAWSMPVKSGLRDVAAVSAADQDRKARFIRQLLPAIRAANRRIDRRRYRLHLLADLRRHERPLPEADQSWLKKLADQYQLDAPATLDYDWLKQLLRRVDRIPADLALAQAAIESGWGRSRFAKQAHNYFGHWCFSQGCGLVPSRRAKGATHEVAVFDSPRQSVRRYMNNLNSHTAYKRLRGIRARLREQDQPVTGNALARGLRGYSALGSEYVRRLQALIANNNLERWRDPAIAD